MAVRLCSGSEVATWQAVPCCVGCRRRAASASVVAASRAAGRPLPSALLGGRGPQRSVRIRGEGASAMRLLVLAMGGRRQVWASDILSVPGQRRWYEKPGQPQWPRFLPLRRLLAPLASVATGDELPCDRCGAPATVIKRRSDQPESVTIALCKLCWKQLYKRSK